MMVVWDYGIIASGAALSTLASALQTLLWDNGEKIFLWQPIFFFQLREEILKQFLVKVL